MHYKLFASEKHKNALKLRIITRGRSYTIERRHNTSQYQSVLAQSILG